KEICAQIDPLYGGWKAVPKFPFVHPVNVLYSWGDPRAEALVSSTLERMCGGGIYDCLKGGFFRYALDAEWKIPHLEKTLYDNALLAQAYLCAWQHTQKELFAQVARKTVEYLLREMCSPLGGFYSAQDAHLEGEEHLNSVPFKDHKIITAWNGL